MNTESRNQPDDQFDRLLKKSLIITSFVMPVKTGTQQGLKKPPIPAGSLPQHD